MRETKPIPQLRRELIFRVMDDQSAAAPLLYQIYCHRRCDDILRYLINANLTGKNFVEWVQITWGNSILRALADVVRRLEREEKPRPIMAGKDFLIRGGF